MERESVSSHINYETLQQNFHLPISQVAKELGVCATVLKKLCRQHGIPRWPHRKIKSLNKMISVLETTKSETEEEEQQRIIELKALLKKKEDIMDNPSIIGPTYSHISPRCGGTKPLGSNINKFAHSSTKTMSSSVNYNAFSPSQLPIQTQIHTHLQNQMQNQQAQITQSYLSQSASSIPKQQQQQQQQQQHSLNYAQTQGNLSTSLRASEGNIHEQSVRALLQQKLSCISHSALQSSISPCRRSPDIVHSAMLPYTSNFRTTPRSRTMSSPQILDNNMNVARPRFNYVPNASANSGELTDSNGNQTSGFSVPNNTNPFSFSRSSAFSQPDPALMSMISPMTMTAIAPVYSSSDLTSGGFIHFPSGNPARASSVPPQFLIPSLNPNNNNNNPNNNNTNTNNINDASSNLGDSNGNLSSSNNNVNSNINNNNNATSLNDGEGSIRTTNDGNSTNMHSTGMNYTLNIPGSRLTSSHQENTDYPENNTTINSTNGTNVIRTLNNSSVGNNSNNDGSNSSNNNHLHQHHHHQLSNMNGNEAHYVPYPSKLPDLCGLEEKNATVGTMGNGGVEDDEDDYYYESTTSNTPPHTLYSYGLDPVSHH